MPKQKKVLAEPKKQPQNKIEYVQMLADGRYDGIKYSRNAIAEALGISPRTVAGYIWRGRNPDAYKAAVSRYFAKKKAPAAERKSPIIQKGQIEQTAKIRKWISPQKLREKAEAAQKGPVPKFSKVREQVRKDAHAAADRTNAIVAKAHKETMALLKNKK